MRREIATSAVAVIVLTILLGILYPLLITGVAQVAFPGNANGQRVYENGVLVGSKIIGQSFRRPVLGSDGKPREAGGEVLTEADPRYFQSRPSATGGGGYDAAASSFSDRGPNDRATAAADAQQVREYLALNRPFDPGLTAAKVPVDAANTSASGLDPEISQANAWIQAHRVAARRGLTLRAVDRLIARHTSGRGLGFSGEPGVNVLELNLALDRLGGGTR
jgi:potassium-transporting ATPase KdpC subunit